MIHEVDLCNDPREQTTLLINMLHFKEPFNRMRARHEATMKAYPNQEQTHGPAFFQTFSEEE
jgi:arylsulfatase